MGDRVRSSLAGKRVVVTRAAEQSAALIAVLREKGAVPIALPLIRFSPAADSARLDESIHHLAEFDWIFITSQNALRAVVERCDQLKLDLREAIGKVRVAAVGPATENAVRSAGLEVAYVALDHNGTSLARELAHKIKGKNVLLPRSDQANPELVELLQKLGARVREVVAYRTERPAPGTIDDLAAELGSGVDAILFFSPSAARHLEELLGRELFLKHSESSAFTAIGPVTEKTLRTRGVRRVLLAEDTTVAAAVAALEEFFAEAALGRTAGAKHG